MILHFKYVEVWPISNGTTTFIGIWPLETVWWGPKTLSRSVTTNDILKKYMYKKIGFVRCGVRTHARLRVPELKSGALDHSANLTRLEEHILLSVYINNVLMYGQHICMHDILFLHKFKIFIF